MALLASTPPTGNAEMISRFLKRDLVDSARITWWFIRRTWAKDPAVARAMFFSEDVPQEDLDAFMPFLRSYLGKPNVVDVRWVHP